MPHVVVLSDTHIRRGGTRRLSDPVYDELEKADLILHAGDVLVSDVLEELRRFAPVHVVLGNNDVELASELPLQIELDVDGVRVAMIHDSGPRAGREQRMRRQFATADVVVFGHSHIPWNEPGVEGQILFNPGSPTERRRQPRCTFGILDIDDGRIVSRRVVPA